MFGGDSPSVRPGAPARYIFGSFTLDVRERRLERDGQAVELPPKVFDALALLLARAGRLVRKDEFNTLLWPGMVVSETNLNKCIWQVRKALDDGEGADRYTAKSPCGAAVSRRRSPLWNMPKPFAIVPRSTPCSDSPMSSPDGAWMPKRCWPR